MLSNFIPWSCTLKYGEEGNFKAEALTSYLNLGGSKKMSHNPPGGIIKRVKNSLVTAASKLPILSHFERSMGHFTKT